MSSSSDSDASDIQQRIVPAVDNVNIRTKFQYWVLIFNLFPGKRKNRSGTHDLQRSSEAPVLVVSISTHSADRRSTANWQFPVHRLGSERDPWDVP